MVNNLSMVERGREDGKGLGSMFRICWLNGGGGGLV